MASAQDTVYKKPTRITPKRTPSARCASAESMTSARPTGYSTLVTASSDQQGPGIQKPAGRGPPAPPERRPPHAPAHDPAPKQTQNRKNRRRTGSTEPRRLQAEQLRVPPPGRDQRGMVALLEHPSLVQHADVIGAPDGGEPVRDDQRRGALGDLQEPVEEVGLAPGVQPGGRLVQDQDRGAVPHREQRAGQRDPLPLPAGQLDPAVVGPGQHGVPAGQRRQHVQRPRPPGRIRTAPTRRTRKTATRTRCSRRTTAGSARSPGTPPPPAAATRPAATAPGQPRPPGSARNPGRAAGPAA